MGLTGEDLIGINEDLDWDIMGCDAEHSGTWKITSKSLSIVQLWVNRQFLCKFPQQC